MKIVVAGFGRYRRKRKNLTVALAGIFFLMFFFTRLFEVLDANLERYWLRYAVGGDHIVQEEESYVDIMKPVDPNHYFDADDFYSRNPGMASRSSPRLRFGVMAEAQDREDNFENAFILVGIDAVRETDLFGGMELEEGRILSGTAEEIVLPRAIMNALGVSLGERVVLAARSGAGFLSMESAQVVGVQKEAPTSFVFGTYRGWAPLTLVRRLAQAEATSEIICQPGAGSVKGPFKRVPALSCFGISRAVSFAYGFLRWTVVFFLGVFALGIVYQNVSAMNDERRGEIGIYLTYGAGSVWIASLMFGELALYSLYCALLGGAAGVAALGGLTLAGLYPVDMVTDVMMGGERLVLWPTPMTWLSAFVILLSLVSASAAAPIAKAVSGSSIAALFRRA